MRIPPIQPPLVNSLLSLLPQLRTAAPEVEPPAPVPQVQAMPLGMTAPSIAMLLAMAGPAAPNRKEVRECQVARAARGLDALGALHAAQARGQAPGPALAELADWISTLSADERPDEPALAEFLRELELRVRVELAKHERIA